MLLGGEELLVSNPVSSLNSSQLRSTHLVERNLVWLWHKKFCRPKECHIDESARPVWWGAISLFLGVALTHWHYCRASKEHGTSRISSMMTEEGSTSPIVNIKECGGRKKFPLSLALLLGGWGVPPGCRRYRCANRGLLIVAVAFTYLLLQFTNSRGRKGKWNMTAIN